MPEDSLLRRTQQACALVYQEDFRGRGRNEMLELILERGMPSREEREELLRAAREADSEA